MPSESPTSSASTPAPSSRRAIVQSYAVSTASGVPRFLAARNSGTVIGRRASLAAPCVLGAIGGGDEIMRQLRIGSRLRGHEVTRLRGYAVRDRLIIATAGLATVGGASCTKHNERWKEAPCQTPCVSA